MRMARISIYRKWEIDGVLEYKLKQVEAWSRNGLIQQQVADNLGISIDTLIQYKKQYPAFSEALKRGKEVVDVEVENALLKRALGYSVDEVTRERVYVRDAEGRQILDEDGNPLSELVITKKVTKHIQPDTTAQIFWLKNRKPVEWRDRKEVGVTVEKSLEDFFGDVE